MTIVDNDDAVPTAAKLSALVVNDGSMDLTLKPTFASDTYAYDASVGSAVAEVTVTLTKNDDSDAMIVMAGRERYDARRRQHLGDGPAGGR